MRAHGCVVLRNRQGPLPIRLGNPFTLRSRLLALSARAPLTSCSAYIARQVVAAGVAPTGVTVVHPVPPDDGLPPPPLPEERRLVYVGQLVRGKGVDLAIEALAHLDRAVTLEIAGDGPQRAELETLADRRAPGRVRFLGFTAPTAIGEVYARGRVVVVPSRWPEPFGMIGIEAMRRGRAVVGAAHGGIPEWLAPEGGRTFAPGDVRALSAAAAALLDDPTAGARAEAYVRARFSHAATVDAVEQLLTRLR
jgi:glycosyltransferase involved in cell wall biosynthesis